jgi:COMPASS component SWD3
MMSQEYSSYSLKDCVGIHSKPVVDLRWNFDGRFLASASNDKTVKINQLESSGSLTNIQTISTLANQLCWNPEGTALVVVGEDKLVEIWDIRSNYMSFF